MKHARGFAGFALVGILVVLVIVLWLYFGGSGGGLAGQAAQTRSTAKEMSVELNTRQLTLLMVTYHQSNNRLPATFEEMEAPAASYTDPWGNPLTFKTETDPRTGRTRVTYTSRGPDGEAGTPDDLTQTDDLPV